MREIVAAHLPDGFPLSSQQWDRLDQHFLLLQRWNKSMNLTSIRSPEEMLVRHFGESLLLVPFLLDLKTGSSVVDIGAGAGFPGLPLGIVLPQLNFTLLDSHARKCVFLREASRGLANITVINARLEALEKSFDVAVSRGVAWRDISKHLPQVADSLLFLSTEAEWAEIQRDTGWEWRPPHPIPSGENHLIISATVSRGT